MGVDLERQKQLFAPFRKWNKKEPIADEGIIVGSDLSQEWLLPWWWEHYRRWNNYPVAFIDFGMSQESKAWCKKRGSLISLPVADIFVAEKNQIDSEVISAWEGAYGREFWHNRNGWFKKPLACLLSPFQKTIWIDSDCEIRGALKEVFDFCEHSSGIAIAKEQNDKQPLAWVGYNSGVIVFKRGVVLLEEWADHSFERNHEYPGDQDILSVIIHDKNLKIGDLPLIYNWSRCSAINPQAVILHWHGNYGKATIAHQLNRKIVESLD